MAEFASKGVAGTGLGLGIAGTALGILNGSNNGNGLLGGLFGGNCNNTNTLAGLGAVAELGKKEAEIAQLKAEKYADGVGISTFKEVLGMIEKKDERYSKLFEDLNKEAVDNRVRLAQLGCEVEGVKKDLTYTYNLLNNKVDNAIAMANCTFVPWAKRIDGNLLCPEKMDKYNSWTAPTESKPQA